MLKLSGSLDRQLDGVASEGTSSHLIEAKVLACLIIQFSDKLLMRVVSYFKTLEYCVLPVVHVTNARFRSGIPSYLMLLYLLKTSILLSTKSSRIVVCSKRYYGYQRTRSANLSMFLRQCMYINLACASCCLGQFLSKRYPCQLVAILCRVQLFKLPKSNQEITDGCCQLEVSVFNHLGSHSGAQQPRCIDSMVTAVP